MIRTFLGAIVESKGWNGLSFQQEKFNEEVCVDWNYVLFAVCSV